MAIVGEQWEKIVSQTTDEYGSSLCVTGTHTEQSFAAAKIDTYARAISAWNALDKSRRYRIAAPLSVNMAVVESDRQSNDFQLVDTTPGAISPPDTDEHFLSLSTKWAVDATLG